MASHSHLVIILAGVSVTGCVSTTVDDGYPPDIIVAVSAQHGKTLVRSDGTSVAEDDWHPSYANGEIPDAVTLPVTIDGVPIVLDLFQSSACLSETVGSEIVQFLSVDAVDDSTLVGVISYSCTNRDGEVDGTTNDRSVTFDRTNLPPMLKVD